MRLARQTFFYFIFIHAAPFYSFFALRCWRRGVTGEGETVAGGVHAVAVVVAKGRNGKNHTHTDTHTSSSAEPDTPLETGLREVAQQPLSLHSLPSLPASFPSSSRSANVVVCGLALALLCFFSRLFFAFAFAIHLHVCLRLHQKGCRLLSPPLSLSLLVPLSLLAFYSSSLPMTETETTTAQTRQLCCLANKFLAAFSILQNICCQKKKL